MFVLFGLLLGSRTTEKFRISRGTEEWIDKGVKMRLPLREQYHVVHDLLMNCHISILRLLSSTPYFYTSTMSIKLFIKRNMKLDLLLVHGWVGDILDWNKGNGMTVSSPEDEDSLGGLKASKHKFKPLLSQEQRDYMKGRASQACYPSSPLFSM